MIGDAVGQILGSTPALQALVGQRIYVDVMPERAQLPAVLITHVTAADVPLMGANSGVVEGRIQADAWAASARKAREVAAVIQTALSRYTGTPAASGTEILWSLRVDFSAGIDPGDDAFRVRQDYAMKWRE